MRKDSYRVHIKLEVPLFLQKISLACYVFVLKSKSMLQNFWSLPFLSVFNHMHLQCKCNRMWLWKWVCPPRDRRCLCGFNVKYGIYSTFLLEFIVSYLYLGTSQLFLICFRYCIDGESAHRFSDGYPPRAATTRSRYWSLSQSKESFILRTGISILRVVKIRLLFKRVLAEVAHCAKFEFSLLTHICTADAAG